MSDLAPIGQAEALDELRRRWEGGGGPRTLLFAGPESVGRRAAARWLAAYLNCGAAGERPCGRCESCALLAQGAHPDYMLVSPALTTTAGRAKRTLEIRIDQLVPRERSTEEPLGPWLLTRPRFRARVGVIDHAESMNVSAANAFLKLLEEPPAWAVIVLIASGPEALLPTVASRCSVVRFKPVDPIELAALSPAGGEHPAVRLGQPGVLLRAGADEAGAAGAASAAQELLAAVDGDLAEALAAAEAFAKATTAALDEGAEPGPLGWLRESLRGEPPSRYAAALEAVGRCEEALAHYVQAPLACAVLMLDLRAVLR